MSNDTEHVKSKSTVSRTAATPDACSPDPGANARVGDMETAFDSCKPDPGATDSIDAPSPESDSTVVEPQAATDSNPAKPSGGATSLAATNGMREVSGRVSLAIIISCCVIGAAVTYWWRTSPPPSPPTSATSEVGSSGTETLSSGSSLSE